MLVVGGIARWRLGRRGARGASGGRRGAARGSDGPLHVASDGVRHRRVVHRCTSRQRRRPRRHGGQGSGASGRADRALHHCVVRTAFACTALAQIRGPSWREGVRTRRHGSIRPRARARFLLTMQELGSGDDKDVTARGAMGPSDRLARHRSRHGRTPRRGGGGRRDGGARGPAGAHALHVARGDGPRPARRARGDRRHALPPAAHLPAARVGRDGADRAGGRAGGAPGQRRPARGAREGGGALLQPRVLHAVPAAADHLRERLLAQPVALLRPLRHDLHVCRTSGR